MKVTQSSVGRMALPQSTSVSSFVTLVIIVFEKMPMVYFLGWADRRPDGTDGRTDVQMTEVEGSLQILTSLTGVDQIWFF